MINQRKCSCSILYGVHRALGLAMRVYLLMRINAHQMRINAHGPHQIVNKNILVLTKIL